MKRNPVYSSIFPDRSTPLLSMKVQVSPPQRAPPSVCRRACICIILVLAKDIWYTIAFIDACLMGAFSFYLGNLMRDDLDLWVNNVIFNQNPPGFTGLSHEDLWPRIAAFLFMLGIIMAVRTLIGLGAKTLVRLARPHQKRVMVCSLCYFSPCVCLHVEDEEGVPWESADE